MYEIDTCAYPAQWIPKNLCCFLLNYFCCKLYISHHPDQLDHIRSNEIKHFTFLTVEIKIKAVLRLTIILCFISFINTPQILKYAI